MPGGKSTQEAKENVKGTGYLTSNTLILKSFVGGVEGEKKNCVGTADTIQLL